MTQTFAKSTKNRKKSVVLVEYPRKGSWAVGFATQDNQGEIKSKVKEDLVNVFIPTTPNPTSGFLLMFPKKEIKYLDMNFEEASLYEDDASLLETMLADLGLDLSFDQLKERGWVWGSKEPMVLWSEGRFPTPSGKIEIASERAQADGHPRTPQPRADPRPRSGRLRLLSPASKWLLNSSYGNDA